MNFIASWIKGSRNALDISAFSCCIPAFIAYYNRYLLIAEILQLEKLVLIFFQLFLIFRFVKGLVHVHFCKSRHFNSFIFRIIVSAGVELWFGNIMFALLLGGNCSAYCLCDRCQHFKLSRGTFICPNASPRSKCRVCAFKHFVISAEKLIVFFHVLYIVAFHTPACNRGVLQLFDTLFLLVFGNVQENFHDNISVICKLPFKGADIFKTCVPCFLVYLTVHKGVHSVTIPASVKDKKLTFFRQALPITPQPWHTLFLLIRCTIGNHIVKTWVKRAYELCYHRAFACGRPAVKCDYNRHSCGLYFVFKQGELFSQPF